MGEAVKEVMGNTMAEKQKGSTKERRNGMANIFEGIDPAVLEKLGLSEEVIHQLSEEADDTFTVCVAQIAEAVKSAGSMEKSRIHRSLSTTITEDLKQALQNRRRRNAVGNLLELLTSSQQVLLVEHLQEQLDKLRLVQVNDNASDNDNTNVSSTTTTTNNNNDLTTPPTFSAMRGSSHTQGQIACH